MASMVKYGKGLKRIDFSLTPGGPRKSLRLGRINVKTAETWKARIESIIGDKLANRPHDTEVSKWLGGLNESMLKRMRAVGLADGVGLSQVTLGAFLDRFFQTLTGKQSTRISYGNVRRNLEAYLGPARMLVGITTGDADAWRAWLVEHEGLATPTVSRRVIAARTMWHKAMRWKLIGENVFKGVKAGHQANESRKHFVPRSVIDNVIAKAPDTEWKAIIALARYGGLRCPSEIYALRWGDVNWDDWAIRVPCPKLAHHEQMAYRTIPMFPEIRQHLLKLFDEATDGQEHIVAKHRLGCLNLRQQFERIIARAGEVQWPKLFHNLRASRETELMREYDLATVCKWIGNSPAVAAKHYATSVDLNSDFRRATGNAKEAQQKAQQSALRSDVQPITSPEPQTQKALENQGFVDACHSSTNADKTGEWAVQDANYNVLGLVNKWGMPIERYEYTAYGQRQVYSHGRVLGDTIRTGT